MDGERLAERIGREGLVVLAPPARRPCGPGCACPALSHAVHDLLDDAASGRLAVESPQERRLIRRIESALAAFDAGWGILGPDRTRDLTQAE